MKITSTQKRVLKAFRRTGIATKKEMCRQPRHYAPALKTLIQKGLVKELNDNYYLLPKASSWMLTIEEENE